MIREMNNFGCIEVICGNMFSGKTEELIRRLRRAKIARLDVKIFKPKIDTRYEEGNIVSHNQLKLKSFVAESITEINDLANEINAELIDDSENAEKKIQWVAGNDALQIKAIIPDLLFIDEKFNKDSLLTQEVITESAYSNLKDDAEIQFVRLGYYRKESSHQAIFSHK